VKRHLKNVPPLSISALSLFFVGLLSAFFLYYDGNLIGHLSAGETRYYQPVLYVVLLGILGTAIGLVLFNRLLKTADPVVASSVTYLIPAVAVGWGLLDGEQIYGIHYVGLSLIFIGVVLVNRK
jgi:drug/metabolite transporter (DMT)-like permease